MSHLLKENIHPDYCPDDVAALKIARRSRIFEVMLHDLMEHMESDEQLSAEAWLGTLLIGDKRCQVQLVVTAVDSHFVDENWSCVL